MNQVKISNYRKWVKDAYDYYETISRSPDASEAGVTSISGYMYSNTSPEVVRVRETRIYI